VFALGSDRWREAARFDVKKPGFLLFLLHLFVRCREFVSGCCVVLCGVFFCFCFVSSLPSPPFALVESVALVMS